MNARVQRWIDYIQPELLTLAGFGDRSGVIHTGVKTGYVGVLEAVGVARESRGLIAVIGDIDAVVAIRQRLRGTGAGKQGESHNNEQYGCFEFQIYDFSVQRYDFLMKNANISEYFELFCANICIIEKLFVTL